MNSAKDSLLEIRNISKSFPGVRALDDVSFEVREGEVHVLIGENGAGKSTLIKILSGVYQPDQGEIVLAGKATMISNPHHAQRVGIATIQQELMCVPQLSIAENIFLGAIPSSGGSPLLDLKRMHREARVILAQLGIEMDTRRKVGTLGPGEKKLVEIARALRQSIRILILDEPTAALTNSEVDRLFDIIGQLRAKGVAIIYVSHRLQELKRIGDRVTALRDGRHVATVSAPEVEIADLVRMMVGREITGLYPSRRSAFGPIAIEARGLTKRGEFADVSFQVRSGEIVGIAGLLGSGRSAVLTAIFGADPYTAGELSLLGQHVNISSPQDALRAGVGFLPGDRKGQGLVLPMSVGQNISLVVLKKLLRWKLIDRRKEERTVKQLVAQLSVRTASVETPVKNLSGGNQQKVMVARWLSRDPKILLFDEPTAGIDIGAKAEIYRLLDQLARQGTAIVISSGEIPELIGMSDRILVMHRGRLVGEVLGEDATQEKVLRLALGVEGHPQAGRIEPAL